MTSPSPDLLFMKALKARRSGDTEGAVALLEGILAEHPDHADSLEVLGMLISERGELDRAIELTERVLLHKPDSIMAHANISRFYMLKGDKETAEEWQSKARVLGWKDEIARKGEAAGEAGSIDRGPDPETVTRQEQNVTEHPDDARARLQLANSYCKLSMHAKAIPHLRHAVSVDPEMSILYLELGKALEAVGAGKEAVELYRAGAPLADRKGDFMPRNQMQSRLAALEKKARQEQDHG
ncbi:MAG: tetratricopeptide repeat protein [Planctomycetota bacterium]|jgi:tetratricopeptide (TPR) repeat protein